MNDKQRLGIESAIRANDFGAQNPALFPANSKGEQLLTSLRAGVAELKALATAQSVHHSNAQEASTIKDDARTRLSKAISVIARTARTMALETPGVADKFRTPRGTNDQNLLTTTRAFIVAATPLDAEFISYGLKTTFLADLQANITAFEQAIAAHAQAIAAQTASTAAFKNKLESALKIKKQLDTLLSNTLKDDVERLTAWKTASRISRTPRKSPPPSTPPPAAPPAQ